MLTINRLLVYIAAIALLATSCKKDGKVYTLEEGKFPSAGLTASTTNVILSQATEANKAATFSWSAADFGEHPVIAYTLQLTLPSDTSGSNAWANAKSFSVGNNITSYSFIVKDLNNILNTMGLAAGVPNKVVLRVKASVPQYNGSESKVTPVYTNNLVVNITSYNLTLYIPGGYQGWNPGTAPELNPADGRPGMYEAYIYITGSGVQYFKYTNARDWNHTNYGDGGNGIFSTDGNAGGLNVPDGGYYEVTANLNTNRWTATKTAWGIIGDATPGGWGTDTPMTYDPTTQTWKVTANLTNNGSFKFRANNAWSIDFGIDNTGKLLYADNPFFGYTPGLNNLSVAAAGNYTITLDLHNSQHYTYSLIKN
jgi:starch-binding outer membrane protein SusE/F